MGENMPLFLTWLVMWIALFLYIWRLENKLRCLEGELRRGSDEENKE
ncbi:MAG: hypothetical protein RMK18_03550 [Armatimonadota bacterium]|nr:hypothetical protein [Armatimonadota bacterium]MCX7777009.1 hypothetical protein [Armatimonadota bacterium]MDW8024923.1 hypothetical protein [Armatimonadota bacterium]